MTLVLPGDAGAVASTEPSTEPSTKPPTEPPLGVTGGALATMREVSVRFGGRAVVSGIDLEVRAGEVVGLVGRNGAGKTTVLRALLGLTPTASGSVAIGDHVTVGVAFDTVSFPLEWSAREALSTLDRYLGTDLGPAGVEAVLGSVGLARESRERPLRACSHGMRQKVSMAAALLGDPDLLVLDEPHNGLDPIAVHELGLLLRHQAELGRGVLVSSHLVDELDRVCDRVVLIHDGSVLLSARVDDLTAGAGHLIVGSPAATVEQVIAGSGLRFRPDGVGFRVDVEEPARVAALAADLVAAGVALHTLHAERHSLADVVTTVLVSGVAPPGVSA